MFGKTLTLYLYAETPIHPGSGTAISGVVDLPIQRERHTEFPIIQASSLKGILRNHAKDKGIEMDDHLINEIFGEPDKVGGVTVTDARILAFPVRSLKGVFGWVTCSLALDRFKRDLKLAGKTLNLILTPPKDEVAIVPEASNLTIDGKYICLEELKLNIDEKIDQSKLSQITSAISQALPDMDEYNLIKDKILKDLVITTDDVFRELTSMTIELITRIRISKETGTVEEGPWSEEHLPTDTLMYALILIPRRVGRMESEKVANWLANYDGKILQVGGDETVGRGFVRLRVVEGA